MTTSPRPYARYTGLIGATGQAEVRTISGLPSRSLKYISTIYINYTVIASPAPAGRSNPYQPFTVQTFAFCIFPSLLFHFCLLSYTSSFSHLVSFCLPCAGIILLPFMLFSTPARTQEGSSSFRLLTSDFRLGFIN